MPSGHAAGGGRGWRPSRVPAQPRPRRVRPVATAARPARRHHRPAPWMRARHRRRQTSASDTVQPGAPRPALTAAHRAPPPPALPPRAAPADRRSSSCIASTWAYRCPRAAWPCHFHRQPGFVRQRDPARCSGRSRRTTWPRWHRDARSPRPGSGGTAGWPLPSIARMVTHHRLRARPNARAACPTPRSTAARRIWRRARRAAPAPAACRLRKCCARRMRWAVSAGAPGVATVTTCHVQPLVAPALLPFAAEVAGPMLLRTVNAWCCPRRGCRAGRATAGGADLRVRAERAARGGQASSAVMPGAPDDVRSKQPSRTGAGQRRSPVAPGLSTPPPAPRPAARRGLSTRPLAATARQCERAGDGHGANPVCVHRISSLARPGPHPFRAAIRCPHGGFKEPSSRASRGRRQARGGLPGRRARL